MATSSASCTGASREVWRVLEVKMHRPFISVLATFAGVISVFLATFAEAGDWTGRSTIEKVIVQPDRTIIVVRASEDWPNPDGCDNPSRAILLQPDKILSYDQAYAALLGAKLNNQFVSLLLDGCTDFKGVTSPIITAVAILT